MKTEKLPALNSKKEPNVIKVTNPVRDKDNTEGSKQVVFEFPAESFEYSQYESYEEFVQDAGSAERALDLINEMKKDTAVTAGKNYIRNATKGTNEEIIAAGLAVTKSHSFAKSSEFTAKEAKDTLLSIKGDLGNLTDAQIADMIRKVVAA